MKVGGVQVDQYIVRITYLEVLDNGGNGSRSLLCNRHEKQGLILAHIIVGFYSCNYCRAVNKMGPFGYSGEPGLRLPKNWTMSSPSALNIPREWTRAVGGGLFDSPGIGNMVELQMQVEGRVHDIDPTGYFDDLLLTGPVWIWILPWLDTKTMISIWVWPHAPIAALHFHCSLCGQTHQPPVGHNGGRYCICGAGEEVVGIFQFAPRL